MANFRKLSDDVGNNGDIKVVNLGELRSELGYDRLGRAVLATIANELESVGLGYFPKSVIDENDYPRMTDTLRVFRKGSALGQIAQGVLSPTIKGDDVLRQAAAGDTGEILKKIRLLVCEP